MEIRDAIFPNEVLLRESIGNRTQGSYILRYRSKATSNKICTELMIIYVVSFAVIFVYVPKQRLISNHSFFKRSGKRCRKCKHESLYVI